MHSRQTTRERKERKKELSKKKKKRKKERVTVGTGQWSGVDGKRQGENGSGGEPEMRVALGHREWFWVLDFRFVIFFFKR